MSRTCNFILATSASALVAVLLYGCLASDPPSAPQQDQSRTGANDFSPAVSEVLLDSESKAPYLDAALAQADVGAARVMLESEGYAYVDSNSLVLLHRVVKETPGVFKPTSSSPGPRSGPANATWVRTDTVVWLAFESPTHDLAKHTAVLFRGNGTRSGTILMELDIATETPSVLRQGYFEDGEWHSADIGTEAWLACMAGGLAGSIVRCSMTNCGFGHCMGAGAAISLAGCTAVSLWNWMSK